GQVTGTVAAPSGRKLAGVCAVVTTAKGEEVNLAITRADGTYRIRGLDPGRYRVVFVPTCSRKDANFGTVWWPDSRSRANSRFITVRLGKATKGINAVLPRLGMIDGIIRLGSTSGPPLAGMCVYAYSPTSIDLGSDANSRRNGTFSLPGLTSGRSYVGANP